MLASADMLIQQEKVKLYVATVSPLVRKLEIIEGKQITYCVLPYGNGNLGYNKEYESYWQLIKEQVNPDVVHIHGTEYTHGLAYIRACGNDRVVASIAAYLSVFTSSISSTFQPDTYEAIIKDNRRKLFKVVAVRWFLTLGVVSLFILFCPIVIKILTAGKYMAARIFACVSLTSTFYYIINDYSIARGRPKLYLITTILGSVFIILLMPIFIKRFSYSGGAIINVLSFLLLFVINSILLLTPINKPKKIIT